MKKIIRLIIIIFCIFFILTALPGNFISSMRLLLLRGAESASRMTLYLAEKIDEASGGDTSSEPAAENDDTSHDSQAQDPDDESEDPDNGSEDTDDGSDDPERNADDSDDTSEDRAEDGNSSSENGGDGDSDSDKKTPAVRDVIAQEDVFCYYYTKISREERLIYDAMLSLAQSTREGDEEARLLSLNPSSDEFAESYTRAYNALMSDHPELFWISQGRMRYECKYYILPVFGGKYRIVLSLSDSSGKGLDEYLDEQDKMITAAEALLDQVDFTQSDAGIALQLHDLLIDSAWYNIEAGPDDYAHTAYGALVEDSSGNPGGALCDGYALAYEYLLQRAGLTCTMVCGYAGASDDDTEKHAWNLVLLDQDWYEVDATWDDLDFLLSPSDPGYELLLEALSDEEYMSRIRHYMFNRTTEEMRNFTPGDEFRYVSYNGWVTLLQPSVHIRFSSQESEETRDYVTPLAPQAEGTWYTWEMLTGIE